MRLRLSLFDRVPSSYIIKPFFCLISPLQNLNLFLSSLYYKTIMIWSLTVGLGFAWCRSGTNWLTQPRDFITLLVCEQEIGSRLASTESDPRGDRKLINPIRSGKYLLFLLLYIRFLMFITLISNFFSWYNLERKGKQKGFLYLWILNLLLVDLISLFFILCENFESSLISVLLAQMLNLCFSLGLVRSGNILELKIWNFRDCWCN